VTHTELPRDTRHGPRPSRLAAFRLTAPTIGRPSAVWVIIAACAAVGLFLRGYQLARPGYLLGVTEYDDGVMLGNALRLVDGVIPYRDFSMVQPPGGMLLMVPAALLAKVTGTASGLAAARLLTVGADTADIVLLGLLVRHRGPAAAGVACGVYAVYPDAIVAAHTFLLEPWLNLFCLAGAVAIFDHDRLVGTAAGRPEAAARAPRGPDSARPVDGDRLVGTVSGRSEAAARAPRVSDTARLVCGGLLFGFAVAVKVWALVPLGIAGLLLVVVARRVRPTAAFAGGAVAGLGVPLLPFAVLAPGALARGVLIGQLVRDANGARHLLQRLSDLAGLGLHPLGLPGKLVLTAIVAGLAGCCLAGYLIVGRRSGDGPAGEIKPGALDAYALAGAVAVTAMLLWPTLYYTHYGSFDAPFLALAFALPVGLLTARRPVRRQAALVTALGLMIAAAGWAQVQAESRLRGAAVAAAADRLIPVGACVVTNDAADTVVADRFYSDVAGCPEIVDSFGAFFAMTSGLTGAAPPEALQQVVELWQTALDRAQYVWLTKDTVAQIPWDRQLSVYFRGHFRLIGLAKSPTGNRYVPTPGIYTRT
jgi:alpha-1,2-mannosyltransferase